MLISSKPFMNQIDAIISVASNKLNRPDKYANMRCNNHCFTGKEPPKDCLYVEIDSFPQCDDVVYIDKDKTNAIVKDKDPTGQILYSHQIKRNDQWRAHCSIGISPEMIFSRCKLAKQLFGNMDNV